MLFRNLLILCSASLSAFLCPLYLSHLFLGSYVLLCTLIWSCLISSFDFILFDLILHFLLRSCHLYALHKFSWVFWYGCKSVVWKTFVELPLVRPLLVPVFFFIFLFWCERNRYLLLWILSSCILIPDLWIFFCFAFQEWITGFVITSCRLRNSHWGSFTGANQAICWVNVLYQMIRPLSNYRFNTITVNQFW